MFVIFQVKTGFLINQLTKYLYTRQLNPFYLKKKKNLRSSSQNLLKRPFFTTFIVFLTVDEVCYISNKNQPFSNNLAKRQYFYTREFISLLHFEKKIGALHRKSFSKHPLFTTFSLFLKMSDVCNISSKCRLPNKSAKKLFLHKTPYTPCLFQTKFCALHRRIF